MRAAPNVTESCGKVGNNGERVYQTEENGRARLGEGSRGGRGFFAERYHHRAVRRPLLVVLYWYRWMGRPHCLLCLTCLGTN